MKTQAIEGREYLRPVEAARWLGLTVSGLYGLCRKAGLPAPTKLSRRCSLFDVAAIREWLDKRKSAKS
jgi:predicted DNA-binding transcriptional regulator AlpA